MCFSLRLSSAEVASSKINIGAFFRIARAIAIRWRSPPESTTPRSPTLVWYPFGKARINSSAEAFLAAATTSASEAPVLP